MNLLFELLQNLSNNFSSLRHEFTGISFNLEGVIIGILNCIVPVLLILLFYLVGEKSHSIFFKGNDKIINSFISISLGFIIIATFIALLGIFGILQPRYLYFSLLFFSVLAFYPITTLRRRLHIFYTIKDSYVSQFVEHKWINIAILGFVVIAFLKLIPPETGVDALWYHTDYPKKYLESHSMMFIDPVGKYYPGVTPTLGDMLYILTQSLGLKDSSRFVHFIFYILVVVLILIGFRKKYPFVSFAVLLFVTSSVIIRHTSTAYAEFQWLLCWLLAVFLITAQKKLSINNAILSGILFGGTLATKLWMLPFVVVFLLYIFISQIRFGRLFCLKLLVSFSLAGFATPFIWYARAFMITGNPIFPMFWIYPSGQTYSRIPLSFDPESIKQRILGFINMNPLSLLGLFFFLPFRNKKIHLTPAFLLFGILLTIVQFCINYTWHRFLIPFYSVIIIFLAIGIKRFITANKYFKTFFVICYFVMFSYYFINNLLLLPYGLGWADDNKYLSRVLSRDNSSYYDYERKFSKWYGPNDLIAAYGLWGFYYSDFKFFYAEDIFRKKEKTLGALIREGATKLLIKGGDIVWLCTIEVLTDCQQTNYKLLVKYTTLTSQFLYELPSKK